MTGDYSKHVAVVVKLGRSWKQKAETNSRRYVTEVVGMMFKLRLFSVVHSF